MDPASRKRALRRELEPRRRAVSPDRLAAAARAVTDALAQLGEWDSAERVALYAALPGEIPVTAAFAALIQAGRIALLPRVVPAGTRDRLEFARVERWEDLRVGRYGVSEPRPEAPAVRLARGDLVLVPGVAFDLAGHRLGRGGGHYDRAFASAVSGEPWLCGVALELQVLEALPHEAHDRDVDLLVTERAVRRFGRGIRGA